MDARSGPLEEVDIPSLAYEPSVSSTLAGGSRTEIPLDDDDFKLTPAVSRNHGITVENNDAGGVLEEGGMGGIAVLPTEVQDGQVYALKSLRGSAILMVLGTAQMMDNVNVTSVTISLPALAKSLGIDNPSQLQWLQSAYTLVFGGFLLLSGVLADRYGRKLIFESGMLWLGLFTVLCGVQKQAVALDCMRALQGLGAALTVPSAIGIVTNTFTGDDRNRALGLFGAAGAVGFVVGIICGGFIADALSWQYIFFITGPVSFGIAIAGFAVIPGDRKKKKINTTSTGTALGISQAKGPLARIANLGKRRANSSSLRAPGGDGSTSRRRGSNLVAELEGDSISLQDLRAGMAEASTMGESAIDEEEATEFPEHSQPVPNTYVEEEEEKKPAMDFLGAGLGTSGMILLTFVVSGGEQFGWTKGFILACLFLSIGLLIGFAYAEKKVQNPLMPLYLWKQKNFAVTWVVGFLVYCYWSAVCYYIVLISENICDVSPTGTSLRLIPMGVLGFLTSFAMGTLVDHVKTKILVVVGLALCVVSAICIMVMDVNTSFWRGVFPASIVSVVGISTSYNVISISMLASVPKSAKSLAGGLINTGFQLGSGVGVAIAAAVAESAQKTATGTEKEILLKSYQYATYSYTGIAGFALILAVVGLRDVDTRGSKGPVH